MLDTLLITVLSWGRAPPPPPPPPPPSMVDTILAISGDYPKLTTVFLVWLNLYLLLSVIAAMAGKKPGAAAKVPASDVPVYKAGEPVTCTDPKGEAIIRVAQTGIASLEPTTLCKMFKAAAVQFPLEPALKVERPTGSGTWLTWSWSKYYKESLMVAKGLLSSTIDFQPHDCVNIIGFNSPEWFMGQMGAILAGGKAAGVYTTNEPSACQYVAEHSEAKVIFVEDGKQLTKYLGFKEELPGLKMLVQWTGNVQGGITGSVPALAWKAFNNLGVETMQEKVDSRMAAVKPGHCATLIYTSGTTGNPKAVMISHDNIVYESVSAMMTLFTGLAGGPKAVPKELRIVSYLPLSHVAAQMLDIATPMVVTALGKGYGPPMFYDTHYTTWFADPMALKGTLKNTLVAARPTAFLGVPRVWEKIRETLMEVGRKNTGLKKVLSNWAKGKAKLAAQERQLGESGKVTIGYLFAKKLLGKVRQALGLDECVACLTAAAPMPREVAEYFASVDIDLLDVYGMSECTGATTCSTGLVHQFGTVGPAIGPAEIRIDHVAGRDKPSEGEICYRYAKQRSSSTHHLLPTLSLARSLTCSLPFLPATEGATL